MTYSGQFDPNEPHSSTHDDGGKLIEDLRQSLEDELDKLEQDGDHDDRK